MARKLTPEVVAKIHQRRAAGLTQAEIARELGISHGSVGNALKIKELQNGFPPPKPPISEPLDDPPVAPEPSSSVASGETLADLRGTLLELVRTLQGLAKAAKDSKDGGVYLQIARVTAQLVKEVARLTPPDPPDHEQAPDMVEAAARMRDALHAMVDRELDGAA